MGCAVVKGKSGAPRSCIQGDEYVSSLGNKVLVAVNGPSCSLAVAETVKAKLKSSISMEDINAERTSKKASFKAKKAYREYKMTSAVSTVHISRIDTCLISEFLEKANNYYLSLKDADLDRERLFTTEKIMKVDLTGRTFENKQYYIVKQCFNNEAEYSVKEYSLTAFTRQRPTCTEMFATEAKIYAKLKSKYILELFQVYRNQNRGVLVLEKYSQTDIYDLEDSSSSSGFRRAVRQLVEVISESVFLSSSRRWSSAQEYLQSECED